MPNNIFSKWFRDTRRKVVEVKEDGRPSQESVTKGSAAEYPSVRNEAKVSSTKVCQTDNGANMDNQGAASAVRIWLELHLSSGLDLSRKNLDNQGLVRMVENLEELC